MAVLADTLDGRAPRRKVKNLKLPRSDIAPGRAVLELVRIVTIPNCCVLPLLISLK